jgi:hypothetical protein
MYTLRYLFFILIVLAGCAGTGIRQDKPTTSAQDSARAEAEAKAGVKPQDTAIQEDPSSAIHSIPLMYGTLPKGIRFILDENLPDVTIAPGVGAITGEAGNPAAALSREERRALTGDFRAAYLDGLMAGLSLTGVLGGDRLHGWPTAAPASWVQNWRSAESRPNSWGLPFLILALRGLEGKRAFIVEGPILDAYGRSGGIKGENGAAGYGAPRGNRFFYEGGMAQRFDFGFILVNIEGKSAFIPYTEEDTPIPPLTGVFPAGSPALQEQLRSAFSAAWYEERDRHVRLTVPPEAETSYPYAEAPSLKPDGQVEYLDFGSVSWSLPFPNEPIQVRGLYVQFFDQGRAAFVLPSAPPLPPTVQTIVSPFLDTLVAASRAVSASARAPGAESLSAETRPLPAPAGLTGALLEGLAIYGIPLTSSSQPAVVDDVLVRSQRFSKGWLIHEE